MARHLDRIEPADVVGQRAAQRTLRRVGARKVATQEVPVLFDPDTAASLLGNLCSAVSGSTIYRGTSFLVGKLGERVATSSLTVVDDFLGAGRSADITVTLASACEVVWVGEGSIARRGGLTGRMLR